MAIHGDTPRDTSPVLYEILVIGIFKNSFQKTK